jgi:hypothetical protein
MDRQLPELVIAKESKLKSCDMSGLGLDKQFRRSLAILALLAIRGDAKTEAGFAKPSF